MATFAHLLCAAALDSDCSPQPVAPANKRPSQSATRARGGAYEGAYLTWRARGAKMNRPFGHAQYKKEAGLGPAGCHLCARAASELSSSQSARFASAARSMSVSVHAALLSATRSSTWNLTNRCAWRMDHALG